MDVVLHENEIPIDVALVRNLVDSEFPGHEQLPLSKLSESGSSNILFRLGDELLVRLPRQPGGSAGIEKEQRWTDEIGGQLPVAVPTIVRVCQPACGYTEQWSIVRWIDGRTATAYHPGELPKSERSRLATDLADVITALRNIEVPEAATTDPALRWYRGRSLAEFDKYTRRTIQHCRSIEGLDLDLDAALVVWDDAMALPGAHEASADRWYHSDLVSENLLLSNGKLVAVLDFGGLAVGDPTIDLHGAWELFDEPNRDVFRARLNVDEPEWLRGRAWALAIALGAFAYYWKTMPGRMRDRLAMARSVLADAG